MRVPNRNGAWTLLARAAGMYEASADAVAWAAPAAGDVAYVAAHARTCARSSSVSVWPFWAAMRSANASGSFMIADGSENADIVLVSRSIPSRDFSGIAWPVRCSYAASSAAASGIDVAVSPCSRALRASKLSSSSAVVAPMRIIVVSICMPAAMASGGGGSSSP